jgi:hypothetical protein
MITPFPFLFLPKETLKVFVHPLKETFLEQKQYNDQLACSLQQSAGLNCTRHRSAITTTRQRWSTRTHGLNPRVQPALAMELQRCSVVQTQNFNGAVWCGSTRLTYWFGVGWMIKLVYAAWFGLGVGLAPFSTWFLGDHGNHESGHPSGKKNTSS